MPRKPADWHPRGVRAKNKPFRYKIFANPDWLDESLREQNPFDKKHAQGKQIITGEQKTVREAKSKTKIFWKDSAGERKISYHRTMVRLFYQAYKSCRSANAPNYGIYRIDRVGAPGNKEWICDRTHYVAKPVAASSVLIQKNRIYYQKVEQFSIRAYNWLSELPPEEFSAMLASYLNRLIIFPLPFAYEFKRLEKIYEERLAKTGDYYGKIKPRDPSLGNRPGISIMFEQ